jgi:anti-sigma regulatory factor (Ser/Thr protein kinase)
MPVLTATRPNGVDVAVVGQLGARLGGSLVQVVGKALVEVPPDLVVDLERVTGLTPSGVGALFVLADLTRDWPETSVAVAAEKGLLRRLTSVRVSERLVIRASLAAAHAALGTVPDVVVHRLDLAHSLESPAVARRFVLERLPPGSPERLKESAALVVTELVSNAVLHGGEQVQVRVVRSSGRVRITVVDSLPVEESFPYPDRTLDDEGGRGLMLVNALSLRSGVTPSYSGGKAVWSLLSSEPD